jgi:hypothetical protein
LKIYLKAAAAAWMKQNPQRKITLYQMGLLGMEMLPWVLAQVFLSQQVCIL